MLIFLGFLIVLSYCTWTTEEMTKNLRDLETEVQLLRATVQHQAQEIQTLQMAVEAPVDASEPEIQELERTSP